jgi:hypothetical protein
MLVSSDFLGYLSRKKELEKDSRPLVSAALKSSPGGKDKSPPLEPVNSKAAGRKADEEVDYLNAKSSTVSVVL